MGATDLVGQTVAGRYRVEALLGEGGVGAVYLAEHVLMRKKMALKVLHPEMSQNPEVVARFEREAMAAGHIGHPNVAAATDFGRMDDGAFFLVLEYIEGTSLTKAIATAGRFPAPRAVFIARQIASALGRAHQLGIVHRDLKPDNVMLVDRGTDRDIVKVLDFGIAKLQDEGLALRPAVPGEALTRAGTLYGTPQYMAPEQALGEVIDARADLYALGTLLYEMLAGRPPFANDDMVQLLGKIITAPPPALEDVPPELDGVVRKLLGKAPGDRYATAGETEAALADALPAPPTSPRITAGSISDAMKPSFASAATMQALPISRPRRWRRMAALGAVAVVLLALSVRALSSREGVGTTGTGLVEAPARALDEAELRRAAQAGPEALEQLAAKHGPDARILRALVRANMEARRPAEAMRALGRLIAQEPSAATEPETLQTATTLAVTGGEGADEAFALLEGPLGARGLDALYELATRTGPASSPQGVARTRALQVLTRPEVRRRASPALSVALELRAAKECEAKRALLPRVQRDGDARSLAYLKPLVPTKGCGFLSLGDCWRCLRQDSALRDAMEAVDTRR